MQKDSKQKLYVVTVELESGKTRDVNVKASTQKVAHSRALKRTPGAVRIARNS